MKWLYGVMAALMFIVALASAVTREWGELPAQIAQSALWGLALTHQVRIDDLRRQLRDRRWSE